MSSKRGNVINWEEFFMFNAKLNAERSKDPRTQVGAIIVDERKRIVATGYNGLVNGLSDDLGLWGRDDESCENLSDKSFKKHFVIHAEMNALLNSSKKDLRNTTLYTTHSPCSNCAKMILQAGIKRIVYEHDYKGESEEFKMVKYLCDILQVKLVKFKGNTRELHLSIS